ncbi:hypothetical protein QQF64_036315 [Cirrhinus molitorella]|uniref:Uncharacterized protein n=1 Tax=Cirrhinus molitorella TaxID=172907 RepID=A0ABR3NI68_9TELE
MKFGWQTAKSHILRDITSSEEETHLYLPREDLPAQDQEVEDCGGGEGWGEGELAAAVKLRCQPAHVKRDGMMLMFQT